MKTNFKFARLSAVILLVEFFPGLRAGAFLVTGSYNVAPSADAFVTTGPDGNLSADNFGGNGSLAVSAGGLPNGQFQSLLRFDLAGAVASLNAQCGVGKWQIFDVTLTLWAVPPGNAIFNNPAGGSINVSLMQNDTWLQGTGTAAAPANSGVSFNNLPAITSPGDPSLGTFSVPGSTSGQSVFTLALTPGITGSLNGGTDLDLRLSAADNSVAYAFASASNPNLYPLLTVNVVPEPGMMTLGALGMSVLFIAGFAKRRRG
jgi:hypothetical protein